MITLVWALGAGLLAMVAIAGAALVRKRQAGEPPAAGRGLNPRLKESIACLDPGEASRLVMEVFPGLTREAREELGGELVAAGLVGRFIQSLSDGTEGSRAMAAEILGFTGSTMALAPLLEALADRADAVSLAAAQALNRLESPAKIPLLVAALREPKKWLPARVGQVLLHTGEEALLPLVETLATGEPETRRLVADLLGEMGDGRAVNGLIEALEGEDAKLRAHAAEALGRLGEPVAIPPLMSAMTDPSWEVRSRAVKSLGQLRAREAIPLLQEAVKDPEWWVRANAEEALAQVAASSEVSRQESDAGGKDT